MEELSIEEKAKAYDEALERIKSWAKGEHPECFSEAQKAAEFIFPELKERWNEDKKIRKELIEQVAYIVPNNDELDDELNILPTYQKRIDKYRAWLEKQGEHRSLDADKVIESIYELKELKQGERRSLDADKVIKWIDEHVPTKFEDMENYVKDFIQDFGL